MFFFILIVDCSRRLSDFGFISVRLFLDIFHSKNMKLNCLHNTCTHTHTTSITKTQSKEKRNQNDHMYGHFSMRETYLPSNSGELVQRKSFKKKKSYSNLNVDECNFFRVSS